MVTPHVAWYTEESYHADLVLIDDTLLADPQEIHSKCGWSPFAGIDLHARVQATWVNGVLRYREGRFLEGPNGQALTFER